MPDTDIEREVRKIGAEPPPRDVDVRAHEEMNQFQKLELESRRHDLEARKKYGRAVFWLVAIWILLVLAIVVWSGYSDVVHRYRGPKLSDGVLIALISGLSVNVIGLLTIVVTYLFPKR